MLRIVRNNQNAIFYDKEAINSPTKSTKFVCLQVLSQQLQIIDTHIYYFYWSYCRALNSFVGFVIFMEIILSSVHAN